MSTEHSIIALCQRSRDISLEKGWLNPDGTDPRPFHTVTSLFHTELSEAFEDIRSNKGLNELYYEVAWSKFTHDVITGVGSAEGGKKANMSTKELAELRAGGGEVTSAKPCGIPIELADFVIRVAQYYGSAGQGGALSEKMQEIAADNMVKGAPIPDDAELLVTQLHAGVSLAWLSEATSTPLQYRALHYLAEALITTFAFCKKKDINLWAAIDEKEAYNRTRPQKHGGKKM